MFIKEDFRMQHFKIFCLFIFAAAFGFVQAAENSADDGNSLHNKTPFQTAHFEVWAGDGGAAAVGRGLEERFTVFNRLFRFDPALAALPLKVRVFQDSSSYNQYVQEKTGTISPGAVYLHYNRSENRELVIDLSSEDKESALSYQAFIQFFRAFIPQPPEWMREGFAVFFSTLTFTEEKGLLHEENLAWLETVKTMRDRPHPQDILLAKSADENFQALAWSLVSFFFNSEKAPYMRVLTDSFMAISPVKNAEENAQAVIKRIFLVSSPEDFARDYQRYLDSRKTFAELVAEGQKAYARGDKLGTELSFRGALVQKPDHFVPYYYLGLLAYNENNFELAEQYYRTSITKGAEPAMVLYALGINSAATGKNAEAADYLRQAAEANPEAYRKKAEALIVRLGQR